MLKLTHTWEVVRDTRCLFCMEMRQNHVEMNSESESEKLLAEPWQKPGWREPWQEKPGWKHTRTEPLGESESERREELELSEVQEMCLEYPITEMMSRWLFGMRTHLAVTSKRTNTKRKMRGIRVDKRGSGATSEEQEAPNTSASSDPCVVLEHPASCEIQSRPGSVLVQNSGRVDDDVRISALDVFHAKDGRRSRYIRKVLEWYQGEDAGDLKIFELVEKWTCINVLEKDIFKSNPKILMKEKSWRTWKSNLNIVMNEKLVQNIVVNEALVQNIVMNEELVQRLVMDEEMIQNVAMGEKFVKNFVMGAKFDPKVEMILSMFKTDGWKILQLSNRKLLEELRSRDSSLVMRYVGTSTREGLREMVQCYRRQHFAASNDLHEHPRGHSSWRESTRMKFMNIQMKYSKMRSEPNEHMWKTRVILIHLEKLLWKRCPGSLGEKFDES